MFLELFRKKHPRHLTDGQLLEREFNFQQAVKNGVFLRLRNPHLWILAFEAIIKANKSPYITESQIDQMIDYIVDRSTVGGNFSVLEVINASGVARVRDHYFLKRVAFNYDHQLTARQRREQRWQEFLDHKIPSFSWTQFYGVSDEVKLNCFNCRDGAVDNPFRKSTRWNKTEVGKECVYSLSQYWQGSHTEEYLNYILGGVSSQLFPILQHDELLKAAPCEGGEYHLNDGGPSIVNIIPVARF